MHALQVTYPLWLARLLHRTPLVIAVTLPLLLSSTGAHRGGKGALDLGQVLRATGVSAVGFLSAVILPVALAALMVTMTGQHYLADGTN